MKLFLDLDGVLADFDGHYLRTFGEGLNRSLTNGDPPGMWENLRRHGRFFREMPLMPDAMELWAGVRHLEPTVLTGVPFTQVPEAEGHKREWLREYLGADVPVICCRSKDKYLHGRPGDVLVDDWVKYRHLWEGMGGRFVLHRTARESLAQLGELL